MLNQNKINRKWFLVSARFTSNIYSMIFFKHVSQQTLYQNYLKIWLCGWTSCQFGAIWLEETVRTGSYDRSDRLGYTGHNGFRNRPDKYLPVLSSANIGQKSHIGYQQVHKISKLIVRRMLAELGTLVIDSGYEG